MPQLLRSRRRCRQHLPARPAAQVQTNTTPNNPPATRLKVTSNLVVVRVVVRDAQGKPVNGLRKEDFKLFDSGKEQPIAQFEAESAVGTTFASGGSS